MWRVSSRGQQHRSCRLLAGGRLAASYLGYWCLPSCGLGWYCCPSSCLEFPVNGAGEVDNAEQLRSQTGGLPKKIGDSIWPQAGLCRGGGGEALQLTSYLLGYNLKRQLVRLEDPGHLWEPVRWWRASGGVLVTVDAPEALFLISFIPPLNFAGFSGSSLPGISPMGATLRDTRRSLR